MTASILLPFLFGTGVVLIGGLMMLYDPFRVGAHFAQLALSVFLASVLSWSLWLTGNIIIISFYPTNDLAWDLNIILSMMIGPGVVRFVFVRSLLSVETNIKRDVSIALVGALIGAIFGRFVLAEWFPSEYNGIGQAGSARVMWTWMGAAALGHVHATVFAVRNVIARQEP